MPFYARVNDAIGRANSALNQLYSYNSYAHPRSEPNNSIRNQARLTIDPAFYELSDVLQYLGFLAFRAPVPACKHSAAMFLKLRGWIDCDATHPKSPARPDSDRAILRGIGRQLGVPMED